MKGPSNIFGPLRKQDDLSFTTGILLEDNRSLDSGTEMTNDKF
jgi:hypothetical protein